MIFSRRGAARRGQAGPGRARQHVTQYGNWDNFSGPGSARLGTARRCVARRGRAKRLPVGGITGHFRR